MSGDVSALVQGVALHNPSLRNFLGYGKAFVTTVASEPVDRISMLNIEPSGALTQNNYAYSLRFAVSHYIKYYPAF